MSYQLSFPYKGNQGILISDRIHLHAREDSVLILGKKAIGISSTGTIGIESNDKVSIESGRIELGLSANQQVILGTKFIENLKKFLDTVKLCGENLSSVSETGLAQSMSTIRAVGGMLQNSSSTLTNTLDDSLSQKTYTK